MLFSCKSLNIYNSSVFLIEIVMLYDSEYTSDNQIIDILFKSMTIFFTLNNKSNV